MLKKQYSRLGIPLLGMVSLSLLGCGTGADTRHIERSGDQRQFQQRVPSNSAGTTRIVRFTAESSPAPDLFSEGVVIDDKNAWVTNRSSGVLKRTTDRGKTWQAMSPSTEDRVVFGRPPDMYVVPYFVTATRGWLKAPAGGTWQTDDGGLTWRQIFTQDTSQPNFADERQGWITVYENGYGKSFPQENGSQRSYTTSDGGLTWKRCGESRSLSQQTPLMMFFLTPQLGWSITQRFEEGRSTINGVAITRNGGCSWDQLWISDNSDQKYCGLYFLNENEGWMTSCFSFGKLLRTKDGGKTWLKAPQPAIRSTVVDIYFSNEQEGWIITRALEPGAEEGMYHTSDGGRSRARMSTAEILASVSDGAPNQVPANWKAGRLFQMLLFSTSLAKH